MVVLICLLNTRRQQLLERFRKLNTTAVLRGGDITEIHNLVNQYIVNYGEDPKRIQGLQVGRVWLDPEIQDENFITECRMRLVESRGQLRYLNG